MKVKMERGACKEAIERHLQAAEDAIERSSEAGAGEHDLERASSHALIAQAYAFATAMLEDDA